MATVAGARRVSMFRTVRRLSSLIVAAALLAASFVAWTPPASAAEGQQCFAETSKCVNPLFYQYWQDHGGLTINGYPISDEIVQNLENGQPYTVQYFERARYEYHPENSDPSRVLLGQFGRQLHPVDPPAQPIEGNVNFVHYFSETGHNLTGNFYQYWNLNGGLAQFGYPLSEVISEKLEEGNTYQVQYFERARFEAHPENAAPYTILLGQFGRNIYASTANQVVAPCATGALRADLVMEAGAGVRDGTIHMINTSPTSCSLAGAPQLQVVDGTGDTAPVTIVGPRGAPSMVGIAAAGRGQFISVPVRWSNYCGPNATNLRFMVTMPDGNPIAIKDGISVPPCLGEGQLSTLTYQGFSSGEQPEAAANVLMGYFGSINARDYRAAYAALGATLQGQQPYDAFAAGYANTAQVQPTQILTGGSTRQGVSYEVTLFLAATQSDGSVQRYRGTYSLGIENGTWKIVAANVVQRVDVSITGLQAGRSRPLCTVAPAFSNEGAL